MIAPAAVHPAFHGPTRIFMIGTSTGECVPALRDYYGAHFEGSPALRVAISKDGPYALVSWESGASGGMDLFRRQGSSWCRIAVSHPPSQAGGIFTPSAWLTPNDIAGFDQLDAARARRLFNGPFVTQTLHVRSTVPLATKGAAAPRPAQRSAGGAAHVR